MIPPTTRQSRRNKRHLLLLAACLLSLASCRDGIVYHQYKEINNVFWGKDEVYFFTFRVDDTTTPYDILFEVRNDNWYPYQNLWVFCSETPPHPAPMKQDTLECMLADEFGKWYGKGIALHQLSFPLRTGYTFPTEGEYTFSFRQAMRNDNLRGIREIGLCVRPSNRSVNP
jgi:gliding motility-associated lipoprotein GldH